MYKCPAAMPPRAPREEPEGAAIRLNQSSPLPFLDLVSFRAQGSSGYPRCMGTATLY